LWQQHGYADGMTMSAANMADLAAALTGIEIGDYDRQMLAWLSGFEPSMVAAFCGLISRVRAAGTSSQ
jgi:hypothetical protein